MGYDLTYFVDEVDDEFICTICQLVLQNPLQLPCEHHFCSDCIQTWLKTSAICPIHRGVANINDLKPSARYFRNLLNKLQVKCDFYQHGCESVMNLEQLPHHIIICEYNSNSESFVDGTKLKTIDILCYCPAHLVNQMSERTTRLEEYQETINRQQQMLTAQKNQIAILKDEVSHLRLYHQQEEKTKADPSTWTKQWQKICNMKISNDRPNYFEGSTEDNGASAQLQQFLHPMNPSFKVEIIEQGVMSVGLTSTDHPLHNSMSVAMGYYENSIGYRSAGTMTIDTKEIKVGRNWQVGDLIECGIIFPHNFVNDGKQIVTVFFKKNRQVVGEVNVKMPRENLFPTIQIDFKLGKLKYLS